MTDRPMRPLRRKHEPVQPTLTSQLEHHLLLVARGCLGRRWSTVSNLAAELRMDHATLAAAISECAASGLLRSTYGHSKDCLSLTRAGRHRLDQLEQCRQAEILALQYQLPLPPRTSCEEGQLPTQSPGEDFMPRQREQSWFTNLHDRASAKIDAVLNRVLWSWLSLFATPQPMEARIDDKLASRRRTRGVRGRRLER